MYMYKYRLLHNIFEDKKTRLDLILILLLYLDNLRKKKSRESCHIQKITNKNFFSVKPN